MLESEEGPNPYIALALKESWPIGVKDVQWD